MFAIVRFMKITGAQCRAARALIGISQDDLAEMSGVSRRTIANFETAEREPIAATLSALTNSLKTGGVEFIPENGGGAGVRLRK